MLNIIFVFVIGIITQIFFGIDTYFIFFIILISFSILLYFRSNISTYFWTTCLVLIFYVSSIYTEKALNQVSYFDFHEHLQEITGKVETVKRSDKSQEIVLEVIKISDLESGTEHMRYPKSISVFVSPYMQVNTFDTLKVVGEINFKNKINFIEARPMFFNYESMKLIHNSLYTVSYPKEIFVVTNEKTFYETVLALANNLSEALKNKLSQHMNLPYSSIALGVSTGDQENLSGETKKIFVESGLIHILVLSGANVAFVISLFWYMLQPVKRKIVKVSVAIFISWFFIFLTGFTAPSVRAGTMSSTNILAEYFGKNSYSFYSLLLALFILSLINPLSLIYSPSLHLSFLACIGLFILTPKLSEILNSKFDFQFKKINYMISLFFGIFLTVTPYLLSLTGSTSIFGTLLTILVEPFVMLLTILSFLIILFSFLNSFVADSVGFVANICAYFILEVADFGAIFLPKINLTLSTSTILIYYSILFIWIFKNDIIGKNESQHFREN